MPRQEIIVKIKPDVLKWTIDSSGWEYHDLAHKLNVSVKTLEKWQTRNQGIEIKKLEKLSDVVKRPLALFFLNSPPKESELTDYRKLPDDETVKLSKSTVLTIRRARYLQSVAEELMKMQGIDSKPKITKKITLEKSPEETAKIERKNLGFESEDILLSKEARKTVRDFYNALRRQIESLNIFVLQGSMSIQEVRGLTLSEKFPRIILINSKDTIHAKIFSLLHEYGHILLRKDGMCIPQTINSNKKSDGSIQIVENWCNRFAASVLMPQKEFLDEFNKLEKKHDPQKIVNALSSKFKTSKQATVIRIQTLVKNSNIHQEYSSILDKLQKEPVKKSKKNSTGGPGIIDVCISQRGRKFVSLVLESKMNKTINNSDVIDYLNLNLKHMKKLQEQVI